MPKGPCPDWREVVAADISLFASRFCVFGAVFDADEFVDRTTGAIRRTAIERYARNRAVKDLRGRNLRDKIVIIWRTAPNRSNHSQSMLSVPLHPVLI